VLFNFCVEYFNGSDYLNLKVILELARARNLACTRAHDLDLNLNPFLK